MAKLRTLDLFAGIGGFSLGLEKTGGFETVAFCEIEEYPRKVLAKHWPDVPCYRDVRELTAAKLAADGIAVDVITGGFPCQDISLAGRGAGLAGEKSGLWAEIARLASELRPSFIVLENVSALLGRGLDRVLADLAALGYDAEWECLGAHAVGAPHIRDRIWIVAYPDSEQHEGSRVAFCGQGAHQLSRADTCIGRHWLASGKVSSGWHGPFYGDGWAAEPNVGRVADGVPGRVDRLKSLGNAVVPQIPELIGHAILESRSTPASQHKD